MEAPVASALGDLAFEEIADLADRASSYMRSVAEAAYRREPMAVAVPLRQARLTVKAIVEIAQQRSFETESAGA